MNAEQFPPLPLHEWKSTKETLHLYIQITGKIRMALTPPQNHWWHVPLYVTTQGVGTGPIPMGANRFAITFDFVTHRLHLSNSRGQQRSFQLQDGLSVSAFFRKLFKILKAWDIEAPIKAVPYELDTTLPFAEDHEHHSYDAVYVERFWQILLQVDWLLRLFNSNFCGKACPVQLYWHSFDLAMTRFSGRPAPPLPEGSNRVNRQAYSHEVISFGFWPGDQNVPEPAFYSYTFPAPEGLEQMSLQPSSAYWTEQNGSPMALLPYQDIRSTSNPPKTILNFLESAYRAGVEKAHWPVADLQIKQPA